MRYSVLISSLLFCILRLNAQETYQNSVSSVEEALKKLSGRRNLTYEYLLEKKFNKISVFLKNPIELELVTGYNESLQSFFKEEAFLLMLWLQDYNYLLNALKNNLNPHGSIREEGKEQQSIIPYKDSFYDELLQLSYNNKNKLKDQILSGDLNPEETDFLLLYLDYRLTEAHLESFQKDSLINHAKSYQEKYLQSDYNDYVQSNINLNYKTSNFGLGSVMFIGGHILTDNLGENISGGLPIGGLIDLAYKNISLNFHFTGSLASRVKQNFDHEGLWEKNTRTTLAFGSINIGYALLNNKKMMLTPSIGLASTNVSSYIRNEERGEVNLKINNLPVFHAALTYDYRIKNKTHVTSYQDKLISEFDKTYWILRIKLGFANPDFDDENNVFKGSIFYIGAGIGIFTYPSTAIKEK